MNLTYHAALEYLFSRINYERTAMPYGRKEIDLRQMRELVDRLGDPLGRTPVIHIAGTKGKGSTSAMCAAMLTAAGNKTGLYTSPHLERLEERFVIDGRMISEAQLAELCSRLQPVVTELDAEADTDQRARLTFFELTTALAFLFFAEEQVDWAVLEVGLGGRLDSTNVCRPQVTVITNISFDHTRQLGNSLEAIAGEKAGIIKSGVPVISGVTNSPAREVIERVAAERGAPLVQLGREFDFEYVPPEHLEQNQRLGLVRYRSAHGSLETPLAMPGRHQAANAALALAVRDELLSQGHDISEERDISEDSVRQALAGLVFPARIEVLRRNPTVIIDAAHNVASMQALLDTLAASFAAQRRYLIFAATSDKDLAGILRLVDPFFERIFLTRFLGNARGTPPEDLLAKVPGDPAKYELCPDPAAAWKAASTLTTPDDLICVSGSFFLAGEIRPWIEAGAVTPTA